MANAPAGAFAGGIFPRDRVVIPPVNRTDAGDSRRSASSFSRKGVAPEVPIHSRTSGSGAGEILGMRQLNRALLDRQMLLTRSPITVEQALEHLVGMQSQAPRDPYIGRWSRPKSFQKDELVTLLTDRRAVRTGLMRATIHLVTARDAFRIRPVLQPLFERVYATLPPGQANVANHELGELLALGRTILEETPHTAKALGRLLQETCRERDPLTLSRAVLFLVLLVQVPPRGIWGASHQATWTTIEHWLGQPLETQSSAEDDTLLRYLAAFGPATLADFRASGHASRM